MWSYYSRNIIHQVRRVGGVGTSSSSRRLAATTAVTKFSCCRYYYYGIPHQLKTLRPSPQKKKKRQQQQQQQYSTTTTISKNNSKKEDNKNESLLKVGNIIYSDDHIRKILSRTKIFVMIGASSNWTRPSYFAMKYLQLKGYRIIPINPKLAAKSGDNMLLGEIVYSSISDIPNELKLQIDMVDCFRKPKDIPQIVNDIIQYLPNCKTIWTQLGIVSNDAKKMVDEYNNSSKKKLDIIMDRCPKIEFSRLYGELGWIGIDSKIISSKIPKVGTGETGEQQVVAGAKDDVKLKQPPPQFTGFNTKSIHSGSSPCPTTGARVTPIYQTTAYVFDSVDQAEQLFNLQAPGNIYTRLTNPTNAVLEQRLAALEGGRGATVTSSGHAAQLLALFPLLQPGDIFIASDKLYGGSLTQFSKTFQKQFGWNCIFVNIDNINEVQQVVHSCNDKNKLKALFCESLANPSGSIADLDALGTICNDVNIPLIVDNTMATPYLCNPIQYGATLVVHSTTKFISGHGNSMGGCVIDSGKFEWIDIESGSSKFPALGQPEPAYHGLTFQETFGDLAFTTHAHAVTLRDLGASMSPFNAFLTITGCETLPLRMKQHVSNARKVANWLNNDHRVAWVSYSGLPSSKYYDLAQKYILDGSGGSVFTFGLKSNDDNGGYNAGKNLVSRVQLFSHLANMGDTRSLILHPASTTHRQLTKEQRIKAGAGDDVIRISIGLEDVNDLLLDLDYALG